MKTKPGVIRPMTAIPRLTLEDEDEFHPKPFRQFAGKQTRTDKKRVSLWRSITVSTSSDNQTSVCSFWITHCYPHRLEMCLTGDSRTLTVMVKNKFRNLSNFIPIWNHILSVFWAHTVRFAAKTCNTLSVQCRKHIYSSRKSLQT